MSATEAQLGLESEGEPWCETNDKEKTQAIADAEQHITDLGAQIEELTGLSARLSAEIATLNTEVAENSEALD